MLFRAKFSLVFRYIQSIRGGRPPPPPLESATAYWQNCAYACINGITKYLLFALCKCRGTELHAQPRSKFFHSFHDCVQRLALSTCSYSWLAELDARQLFGHQGDLYWSCLPMCCWRWLRDEVACFWRGTRVASPCVCTVTHPPVLYPTPSAWHNSLFHNTLAYRHSRGHGRSLIFGRPLGRALSKMFVFSMSVVCL